MQDEVNRAPLGTCDLLENPIDRENNPTPPMY
jgi:hypothetical protein